MNGPSEKYPQFEYFRRPRNQVLPRRVMRPPKKYPQLEHIRRVLQKGVEPSHKFADEYEMGARWLAMTEQEDLTQADVDAFIAELERGINNHSSFWLDIWMGVRSWARDQGFSVDK